MQSFQKLDSAKWTEVFSDPCTDDWTDKWFLDGRKARISHSPQGMDFWAGPTHLEDACHAVLWTRQSFKGDVKIEYEYTRLDDLPWCVNILYIQATGSGEGPYRRDISEWAQLREVPAMGMYFNHMNLYHISVAAHGPDAEGLEDDYIRARRYIPEGQGLEDTDLKPDHFRTGLFQPGVPHRISAIKKGNDLYMQIRNDETEKLCHWRNDVLPPITEGNVWLRHMHTRGARYNDFRISVLEL